MEKTLVLGDEAVALGGIDAGMSGIYAYPGTPSTEITEYVQNSSEAREWKIRSEWSANEKTAYEAALGMSYAGKRAMVCMKHVGLNVAADPFINSAITGVQGGLILAVADDPSMHSSQNEQDSRYYGRFAMIPVLEPANQQEAYDMVYEAFSLSEKVKLPVMIRLTTRLSHSRAGVLRKTRIQQNQLNPVSDTKRFIILPVNARVQYKSLVDMQPELERNSSASVFNRLIEGDHKDFGIIACGIAYNYAMEAMQLADLKLPVLKIAQYPLPDALIRQFFSACKKVLILEEGYPVYEEFMRGYFDNGQLLGRLDGTLPRTGELNPDIVLLALTGKEVPVPARPEVLVNRPPALCQGCSHRDVFLDLNEVLEPFGEKHVFSDIGCYTLGALPPFNSICSCVDMGASVTMAKGAADAGLRPAVCVIGDSTFTHSGMTGLLDAVNDKSPLTVVISDNHTTAMTGGQDSPGHGRLYSICAGLGVDPAHIRSIEPLKNKREANRKVYREELAYEGVSVIIASRECIQTASRRKKQEKQTQD
ncbi:MAG: indolepyruvate ferredoxin oxidoreductase [Bacteroidales bacterium]|nr:indolepyruvate ferredoxin oxidoreductase [Bacteroidales bacterium]